MKNLFLLLIFLQLSSVVAQTNEPIIKWVNSDVGLNQLSVSGCAADNNGFVWIGTELGLYRYNWNKAQLVEHPVYKNISKQRIVGLDKDDQTGIIYFRTDAESKIYSIENNVIKQSNDEAGFFIIKNVFLKSNHPMFDAIVKYNDEKKAYHAKDGHNSRDAILTSSYYCIRNSNSIDILQPNGSYTTIDFPGVQKTRLMKFNEAIFVLGIENTKVIIDGKLTQQKVTTDKVISEFMTSDEMNRTISLVNDSYYLNFKNNVYKIEYDTINSKLYAVFLFKSPLKQGFQFSYSEASDVYLFESSNQGMAVVKPNAFNVIYTQENSKNFSDYVVVKKANKWYNYNGWIYDTQLKKIENRFITNYTGMMRFLLDYKGDFFYEAQNKELISIIDLKTKAPFKVNEKITYLVGFAYLNNILWLANEKNCAYLQDKTLVFDTIVHKTLRSTQNIKAISAKGDKLIFATSHGVFLHKPFADDIKYIKGLENVNARYIKHIDKSSFWVGCYGEGLFLVHNNISYKVVDATIDIATAHAIEEDQFGNLWISTNNGLLTVNKQKAIANTLKGIPIECYLYTVSDGLPTDEFNGGSTFPSLRNGDGIIGFPSMKGFVYFNPENIKKRLFSGLLVLDEVVVDTKILPVYVTGSYNIDSNAEVISLKMDYGYSGNTENLSFFYKFEDQKNWTAFKDRKIVFARYKKGSQQLQIKIHTHGFDAKDDVVKSFSFDFEPRFYETSWFWILVLIGTTLVLICSYVIGRRFNKKKERELNEKIASKTQQLQDTISELSVSKDIIKESLTEKEVLLREIHHRVKNNLQLIMSMLTIQARRGNYTDIRDFVKKSESRINAMALIHSRLYLSDQVFDKMNMQFYIEDLITYVNKIYENTDQKVHVKLNANNLNINLTTAIPLGLIINELLSNALKHGFPDTRKGDMTIQITNEGNNLFQLIFEDNGVGFDAEMKRARSFGLELVTLLASQLSGSVQIDTANTTKFIIKFKEMMSH